MKQTNKEDLKILRMATVVIFNTRNRATEQLKCKSSITYFSYVYLFV